jgi:putative hemolysin
MTTLDPAFEHYVREEPGLSYEDKNTHWLARAITRNLEKLMGRPKLEGIYRDLKTNNPNALSFFTEALRTSGVRLHIDKSPLQSIKSNRPLLLIANHPFGVVDGLVMCNLALELRGNFRVVINSLLCQDRELAEYFLPIDFSGTKEAAARNIRAKQLALQALNQNIPLILFPSGMVSTAGAMGFGKVQDGSWSTFVAKLVSKAQPTIAPVYFEGRNSRPFHVASHIAEPIRMAMLLREALKRFDTDIVARIGAPLEPRHYAHISSRTELTHFLYDAVQALKFR